MTTATPGVLNARARLVAAVVDKIGPEGAGRAEVAAASGLSERQARDALIRAKEMGLVAMVRSMDSVLWVHPSHRDALHAKYRELSRARDLAKRAEQNLARKLRAKEEAECDEEDARPAHRQIRVVSASACPPIRTRAPRSVFELGAMA